MVEFFFSPTHRVWVSHCRPALNARNAIHLSTGVDFPRAVMDSIRYGGDLLSTLWGNDTDKEKERKLLFN